MAGDRPATDDEAAARATAVREAAIAEAPAHRQLLRSAKDGRILSALMLPLFVRSPRGYAILTTTGRRTGKRRRKCIRAIRRADTVYIVQLRPPALAVERPNAVASWVWNIRSNPNVRLRLGMRTHSGVAREIVDPLERDRAREAICETVNPTDFGECSLHMRGLPTPAKIRAMHRYWFDTGIPIAVELEGSGTDDR